MLAPSSTRQNIFPGGILHCQKSRGFQENSCRFSASLGQPKGAPTAPLRHPDLSLGRRPSRLGRLVVSSAWESHLPCRSRQRLARSAVEKWWFHSMDLHGSYRHTGCCWKSNLYSHIPPVVWKKHHGSWVWDKKLLRWFSTLAISTGCKSLQQ